MILKLKRFLKLRVKSKIKKITFTQITPLKIWIFSILAFFSEVILFSKYAGSHNGVYAPYQSIIFLITILVGVIAFSILALAAALKFSHKLWLRSKIVFLFIIAFMIVSPVSAYFLADIGIPNTSNRQQVQGIQQSVPTFTGQDVFDAVNSYRKTKGVSGLTLDKTLCNNLAQRYLDIRAGIKENIAHKGFDEWYEKYVKPYGNYRVEEDFAYGNNPQDVIKAWEGSPGHRLSILDKTLNLGCSYAAEGNAVIILGKKQGYSSNAGSQQNTNYQNSQQSNQTQAITHDGSRTGPIVDYYELCTGKTIKIYENERIPYKRITGEIVYSTKGDIKCYEDQINRLKNEAFGSQNTQSSTINCYDPVTKNNYQVSKETCDKWIQEYNQTPSYTPPQYYSCTICYPTLGYCDTYNYLYKTKEECDAKQQEINKIIKTTPAPTTQDNSVTQHNSQVTNCRSGVGSLADYQQRCTAYGGSAAEACRQITKQEWQTAYDACGTTY